MAGPSGEVVVTFFVPCLYAEKNIVPSTDTTPAPPPRRRRRACRQSLPGPPSAPAHPHRKEQPATGPVAQLHRLRVYRPGNLLQIFRRGEQGNGQPCGGPAPG